MAGGHGRPCVGLAVEQGRYRFLRLRAPAYQLAYLHWPARGSHELTAPLRRRYRHILSEAHRLRLWWIRKVDAAKRNARSAIQLEIQDKEFGEDLQTAPNSARITLFDVP